MPTVHLRLGTDDASHIRFGISASHELTRAVAVLQSPAAHPLQWGWLRRTAAAVPRDALATLATVIPPRGYAPDFLAPPPVEPMPPKDQIVAVAETPLADVCRDLAKSRDRARGSRRTRLDTWLAHPRQARAELAGAWVALWDTVLAPWWPQAQRVLDADLAYRARTLVTGGVSSTVAGLHERIRWNGDAVVVETTMWEEDLDCRGSGLLLVPSVFTWPGCSVITQQPQQPTVFYPAVGVSEAWPVQRERQDAALSALLGEGRARVLVALLEPAGTVELAARCNVRPSTVTHHVTALRNAGLVASTRSGRSVVHSLTALGSTLVDG